MKNVKGYAICNIEDDYEDSIHFVVIGDKELAEKELKEYIAEIVDGDEGMDADDLESMLTIVEINCRVQD